MESGITRVFLPRGRRLKFERDEFGFVKPSVSTISVAAFRAHPAVLVRGRPWIGKSFVARELKQQKEAVALGSTCFWLDMKEHSITRPVQPGGWQEWLSGHDSAYWIIDAIDEGELIQRNVWRLVADLLDNAGDAGRARLRMLFFCRESDLPAEFESFLHNRYGRTYWTSTFCRSTS